jgi:hypothetical protein
MEDQPGFDDFFDELGSWPDEVEAMKRHTDQALALFDNLNKGWQRCQKAGLDLLHMANYRTDDYDPTLMQELLDS